MVRVRVVLETRAGCREPTAPPLAPGARRPASPARIESRRPLEPWPARRVWGAFDSPPRGCQHVRMRSDPLSPLRILETLELFGPQARPYNFGDHFGRLFRPDTEEPVSACVVPEEGLLPDRRMRRQRACSPSMRKGETNGARLHTCS